MDLPAEMTENTIMALELLGCVAGAGPKALKSAYRKAAMLSHPDKGGSNAWFNDVKTAYDYLVKYGTVPHVLKPQQSTAWQMNNWTTAGNYGGGIKFSVMFDFGITRQ